MRARSHHICLQHTQTFVTLCRELGWLGLLTTRETQVHFGRLHMSPIQWHLKNNCRVPVSLEKLMICFQVTPPSLKKVAGGMQCVSRSTITATKTCSADLYRRIERRVGCSLEPESKQHINHQGSFSGLKRVLRPLFEQYSSGGQRQHYGGARRQVTLKDQHIPGRLNVITDKLSRLG